MAARAGIEPATLKLTASRSATELSGNKLVPSIVRPGCFYRYKVGLLAFPLLLHVDES